MSISMQTALVIFSLTSLFGLLILILIKVKFELNRLSIGYFYAFYISCVIAPLLIVFREDVGQFLSIIVANTVIFIGNIFLFVGIHKVTKRHYFKYFPHILLGVFLVFMTIFTYGSFNIKVRIIILNFTVGLMYLMIIINLQREKTKFSLVDEFISTILSVLLLAMIARILGILLISETSNEFLRFSYDPFFLLIIGIVNLLIIAGIMSIFYNDVSAKLHESKRQLDSLISNLPGFAYRCKNDASWTMTYLSIQFEKMMGWKKEEIEFNRMKSYMDLIVEDDDWKRSTWNNLDQSKVSFQLFYRMRRKNNDIIWVKEQGTPIFDENGNPAYFEGYIMDITEQKIAEEKLEYLSYHDALTNLYNRRYIEEQIDLLQIEGQFPISIIMGDVDNLKHINDNFGHEAGDYALKIIADSFVKVLGENGSVARIGGDEFLILLENYDQNKVEQFIHSFENGIVTSNSRDYEIRISIGYMIIYSDKQSIRSSIRQAEDKMYQQKKQRKR